MADERYVIELLLTARDEASARIKALQREVDNLRGRTAGQHATTGMERGLDDLGDSAQRAADEQRRLNEEHDRLRRTAPQSQSDIQRVASWQEEAAQKTAGHAESTQELRRQQEMLPGDAAKAEAAVKRTAAAHDQTTESVAAHSSAHDDLGRSVLESAAAESELTRRSQQARRASDDLIDSVRRGSTAFEQAKTKAQGLGSEEQQLRARSVELDAAQERLHQRFRQGQSTVADYASSLRRLQGEFQRLVRDTPVGSAMEQEFARRARSTGGQARTQTTAAVGEDVLRRYREFDRAVRDGDVSASRARRTYADFSQELGSVGRSFEAGTRESERFLKAGENARRMGERSGVTFERMFVSLRQGNVGNFFDQLSTKSEAFGIKIMSLSAGLRGLMLALGAGLFQQLDTAALSLVGALTSVVSMAAQAGAALGGALVAGAAQAVPAIGVLVTALERVKAVMSAVQLSQSIQQQQFTDPTQQTQTQIQSAMAVTSAQNTLTDAYQRVNDAQFRVKQTQQELTLARIDAKRHLQDLTMAEKTAAEQQIGSRLTLAQAEQQLQETQRAGTSLQLAQAQLAVQEAQTGVQQADIQGTRARQDLGRGRRLGVARQPQLLAAERATMTARLEATRAQQAVPQARQQLQLAQMRAASPIGQMTSSQAQLAYLESQMTPAEKRLEKALIEIKNLFQNPSSPVRRFGDYVITPIADAAVKVQHLLSDRSFLAPLDALGKALGSGLGRILNVFTGRQGTSFFKEMATEATRNVPLIADAIVHLLRVFQDIARAASPILHMLLGDLDRFVARLDMRASSAQGQASLRDFFMTGARYAEQLFHLAGAIFHLLGAIAHDAAPAGSRMVGDLTQNLKEATNWIEGHGPQVRSFFEQTRIGAGILGQVIVTLAKALFAIFNLDSLRALGAVLDNLLLPALRNLANVIGFVTRVFFDFLNLIPGGTITLQLLATAFIGLLVIGRIVDPMRKVTQTFRDLRLAMVALRTETEGSRLVAAWDALIGKTRAAKTATEELKTSTEGMTAAQRAAGASAGTTATEEATLTAAERVQGTTAGATAAEDAALAASQRGVGTSAAAGGAGGVRGAVRSVLTRIPGVGAGAVGAEGVAGGLTGAIGGAGIAAAAAGVAALAAAFYALKTNFLGITDMFKSVGAWIGGVFTSIWRNLKSAIDSVFGSGAARSGVHALSDAFSTLGHVLGVVGPIIAKVFGVAVIGGIIALLSPLIAVVAGFTAGVWLLTKAISAVASGFGFLINQLPNIGGFFGDVGKAIVSGVVDAFNNVVAFLKNLPQTLEQLAVGAAQGVANGFKDLGNLILSAIEGGFTGAVDFGKKILGWILDQISSAFNSVNIPGLPAMHLRQWAGLAEGDIVGAQPGGRVIRVAEGGHPEVVLTSDPAHAGRQRALLGEFVSSHAPHLIEGFAQGGIASSSPHFDGHPSNVKAPLKHVLALVEHKWPQLKVSSTTDHSLHSATGGISLHSSGQAVDVQASPPYMGRVVQWINSSGLWRGLDEGIHKPGLSVKHGQHVPASFWTSAVWDEHANHIHLGVVRELSRQIATAVSNGVAAAHHVRRGATAAAGQSGPVAAAVPVVGDLAKRLIDKVVGAADVYIGNIAGQLAAAGIPGAWPIAAAASKSAGAGASGGGRSGRSSGSGGALEVVVSAEQDVGKKGAYRTIQPSGWSELSIVGDAHQAHSAGMGRALGRVKGLTKAKFKHGGRQTTAVLQDVGSGSDFHPHPVIGLYPKTMSELGARTQSRVMIERVDGQPLHPASGVGSDRARAVSSFAEGGEVPGIAGLPQWVLAHGREWVLNEGHQRAVAAWLGTTSERLKRMLGFTRSTALFDIKVPHLPPTQPTQHAGAHHLAGPPTPSRSGPPTPAAGHGPFAGPPTHPAHPLNGQWQWQDQGGTWHWGQDQLKLSDLHKRDLADQLGVGGAKNIRIWWGNSWHNQPQHVLHPYAPRHTHHATTPSTGTSGDTGTTGGTGTGAGRSRQPSGASTVPAQPTMSVGDYTGILPPVASYDPAVADIGKVFRAVSKGLDSLKKVGVKSKDFLTNFIPFVDRIAGTDATGVLTSLLAGFQIMQTRQATQATMAGFHVDPRTGHVTQATGPAGQRGAELTDAATIANLGLQQHQLTGIQGIAQLALRAVNQRIAQARRIRDPAQRNKTLQALVQQYNNLQNFITDLGDKMAQNVQGAYQAQQQWVQDQLARVNDVYQTVQSGLQSRQGIAQALGRFGDLPALDKQLAESQKQQIAALQKPLQDALAMGDTQAADQIRQQIDQLRQSVAQLAAQSIQDAISEIQQEQQGAQSRATLYGAIAQVAQTRGDFGSMGGALAAEYGTNIDAANTAIQRYSGLLANAQAIGDQGAIVTLTDSINQAKATILQNTQALADNTFAVAQAQAQQIQGTGQFLAGTYSGLSSIVQVLGRMSGGLDVPTMIALTSLGTSSLQSTNQGLAQTLLSTFGVDLRGLSGQSLVSKVEGLNMPALLSGMDPAAQATFENLISSIVSNDGAIQQNTEQLKTLNGQLLKPQTWSTTVWQQFRDAVFTGMGGLLPYAAAAIGVTPFTNAPMPVAAVGGRNIEQMHFNVTSPTEVLDPVSAGAQMAWHLKTAS